MHEYASFCLLISLAFLTILVWPLTPPLQVRKERLRLMTTRRLEEKRLRMQQQQAEEKAKRNVKVGSVLESKVSSLRTFPPPLTSNLFA